MLRRDLVERLRLRGLAFTSGYSQHKVRTRTLEAIVALLEDETREFPEKA